MPAEPGPDSSDIPEAIKMIRSDPEDGWWFGGVFDAFAYLEPEFGFRLSDIHQHFRGNFVRYEGPTFDLVVEYDPGDTGHVGADLWVRQDLGKAARDPRPGIDHPRAFTVNDLLRARDPRIQLPDLQRGGYSRDEALAALSIWAAGLRTLAPDVLGGEWPTGVAIKYMW